MTEFIETVVIGAGQAGLAASYHLTQAHRPHIVLERASSVAHAWRDQRWDSFTLVTPNWALCLPGAEYDGAEPDAFLTKDEVVRYLEQYALRVRLPVRCAVEVERIHRKPSGGYAIATSAGTVDCANVVIATGLFQRPKIPRFAANLDSDILQLHSSQYRNPRALPEGNVLVVGAGQSGAQIAEDLYQSGRKTFISVGRTARTPRRYRGQDIHRWALALGMFDRTVDQLKSPKEKFETNPTVSGKAGGRTLNLHVFARDGVVLAGRLEDFQGQRAFFGANLRDDLAAADAFEAKTLRGIDEYIDRMKIDAATEQLPVFDDGYRGPAVRQLDLADEGITSVIWATGYAFDFGLVQLPVFENDGYPIQRRGVTQFAGLYFLGLPWLHSRKSGLLYGVGADAAHVVGHITRRAAAHAVAF